MRRTVLCIVAVAIAVFFTIVLQSMMSGMTSNIEKVVQVFDTGHVSVVSKDFEAEKEYYPVQYPAANGRDAGDLAREIGALPHVRAVFPRIKAFATLQDSTAKHALLWGIKIDEEMALNRFNLTDRSDGLVAGRYPANDANECAIGTSLAKRAGLEIGDRIPLKTVSAQFSDKMWAPVITGIFEFDYLKYDDEAILTGFDRLQRLLVLDGGAQQLVIFADKPGNSSPVAAAVRGLLADDADSDSYDVVQEWGDNYFVAMMRQQMVVFVVVFLIFMIVASFLIVNTVVMIIHERIKEIGMMGSLGMSRREIVQVFFFEAVILAVAGALAGCFVGGLATFILSFFPLDYNALSGGGLKEMPMSGTIIMGFSPVGIVQGFLFGVITASICTLLPSLKSAFVEPVEALRR
jgi:putative ABC transport system permease protein